MLTYEQKLNQNTHWALEESGLYFERRSEVHDTLERLARSLDEIRIDYAIAGAMAMFLHGFRRFTEDVVVLVAREGLAQLHEALEGRGYVKPYEMSKNLRDARTGVKIDFLISGQYPGDGRPGPIAFPIPKDASVERDGFRVVSLARLIELKLASGQASHRIKDLGDVQQMIQHLSLPIEFAHELDASVQAKFRELWDGAQRSIEEKY